jgi:hypothetical protein
VETERFSIWCPVQTWDSASMPTPTNLLDNGDFVCSPETPPKPAFREYLHFADWLLAQWHKVDEQWKRSPLDSELVRQKSGLDGAVSDFLERFRTYYGIKGVEQDPAFWPVSRFFRERHPICEPFSILHADLVMPLHTVYEFRAHDDLARLNAALDEDTPLRWWRSGPHDLPCYLFGNRVWERKPSEVEMSEPGMVLVFLEMSGKHQQRRDRLIRPYSPFSNTSVRAEEFIPEKTRHLVWRRARGRCEKCGGSEGLDFALVGMTIRGGNPGPQSVQMLCGRCRDSDRGVT